MISVFDHRRTEDVMLFLVALLTACVVAVGYFFKREMAKMDRIQDNSRYSSTSIESDESSPL